MKHYAQSEWSKHKTLFEKMKWMYSLATFSKASCSLLIYTSYSLSQIWSRTTYSVDVFGDHLARRLHGNVFILGEVDARRSVAKQLRLLTLVTG